MTRKPYLSDVSDDEWPFVAPYLTLMREDAPQREYSPREVFDGLRYLVHTGAQWRWMPNDLPPWQVVYQQTQRWLQAGVFQDMVRDLRMLMREIDDRSPQPRAAILLSQTSSLDSRTVQSTPESGWRAGYDGHKRRKGSEVHLAADTLGQLLAVLGAGWHAGRADPGGDRRVGRSGLRGPGLHRRAARCRR
jgi:transposase